jgi:cytochrome c-type biogenesis protein
MNAAQSGSIRYGEAHTEGPNTPRRGRRIMVLAGIGAIIVAVLAAILILGPRSGDGIDEKFPEVSSPQLISTLVRYGQVPVPEGESPLVDVLFATPGYYSATNRAIPESVVDEASLVFYVVQEIHIGELPRETAPQVSVDGGPLVDQATSQMVADSEHHRTSAHVFRADDLGISLANATTLSTIEMVFPAADGIERESARLTWDLPLEYAEGVSEDYFLVGGDALVSSIPVFQAPSVLGWSAFLAIMAGMLVALTPCLIQLGIYYAAALAGVGAEGEDGDKRSLPEIRRHIMQTGLFFALGFTLVYTAGGAVAGVVGQSLSTLSFFSTWAQPLSIAAGVVILLMAVRVAYNARVPVVCNLPLGRIMGHRRRTGVVGSAVMGFTFAGGCLSCFAATVLPALLIYAGSTGSVVTGAALLFVFSLGVSIPCLAIAFSVSRLESLLLRLQRAGPMLGFLSAGVMAAFGLTMVAYQFHVVSGWIYSVIGMS